jgi:tellurite resistance protein TehA-like permease
MNLNAWSLLLLPLLLLGFVAYVAAMVNAAQTAKWVWFVLMLLIPPLFLFYFFGAYTRLPPPRPGR